MAVLLRRVIRAALEALPILVLVLGACARPQYHETPVTPAPASADEEQAVRSAILGEWRNWSTIHVDGKEVEEKALRVFMTFNADGTGSQGLGDARTPFTWQIDGKNVTTTDPSYPTIRVESVDADELRLFWYKLSVTLVYKRPKAFTGLRR